MVLKNNKVRSLQNLFSEVHHQKQRYEKIQPVESTQKWLYLYITQSGILGTFKKSVSDQDDKIEWDS